MSAPGDKEYTLNNDLQILFNQKMPADVRKAFAKMTVVEILAVSRFISAELSNNYRRGCDEAQSRETEENTQPQSWGARKLQAIRDRRASQHAAGQDYSLREAMEWVEEHMPEFRKENRK